MAVNTNTFESTLQNKLDNVTDPKEMLLIGKALESTVGSIAVSDIQTEGTTQVNAVNTAGTTQVNAVNTAGTTKVNAVNTAGTTKVGEVNSAGSAQVTAVNNAGTTEVANVQGVLGNYTPTSGFKTVGGTSIVGSGDIATLPSGGSAGQVLKKDSSNNPAWGADEGGKVLQVVKTGWLTPNSATSVNGDPVTLMSLSITVQANSRLLMFMQTGQTNNSGSTCNPNCLLKINNTQIGGDTQHYFYAVDSRVAISKTEISGQLSAGQKTVIMQGGSYNGTVTYNYQTSNQGNLIVMEIAQ